MHTVTVSTPRRLSTAASLTLWATLAACATSPKPTPSTPEPIPPSPEKRAAPVVSAAPEQEFEEPAPHLPSTSWVQSPAEVTEVLARGSVRSWLASTTMAVALRGPVRLRASGADMGIADREPFPQFKRLTVLEDSERPRIVTDEIGVRLLLYVDRADAQPVLLTRAPLRPKAATIVHDPPRRGYAIVEAGVWVTIQAKTEDALEVKYEGHDVVLSGWIDADTVGTSYTKPPPSPTDDTDDTELPWRAKRPTSIQVRPGGKALTKLDEDDAVLPVTLKANGGYRLVEYTRPCHSDISYVGFVKASALHQPNIGMGYGCGSSSPRYQRPWGDAEKAPRVEIEAGRFLLDLDEPIVVGCVTQATAFADLGEGHYAVPTLWGPIAVRLAPKSYEGKCGTGD